MRRNFTRRNFVITTAINAIGMAASGNIKIMGVVLNPETNPEKSNIKNTEEQPFIPVRAASWWCNIEDLLWPQKKIVDKIKYRAEAFAKAKIDTAINFGFHIRFDFSNYFGQLHGYYSNVCDELHKYGIRFIDHYSCNHIERPRGIEEFKKLHKTQRHHVLLFHDPVAAEYAQYEGFYYRNLCQVNLLDGSRGYAKQYQMEAFCHNNPDFLAMHSKYLKRLLNEVPLDGIEVDDMCDYAGLIVCGCTHCRERFKRDFGHEIPPLDNKDFWGNVNLNEFLWGNYANPVFRDWIRMRAESVADHLKIIKTITGKLPLMTCCSSSGPIALNAVNLNLERMASSLDFFMLENCGISVNSVNWTRMDPEAMHQKDIAASKGNAPPLALSYTIYEKGAYLGWCLSRFWGVANWSSTLNQRLEEDPVDMKEIEDIIGPYNNWELINSNLNYRDGSDLVEVRLVNSRFCRENGWRDEKGKEQWEKAAAWSELLVNSNIGYRFVRCDELAEPSLLKSSTTPLILDGIGCVSENQFRALKSFLSSGGKIWLALPFGTHDEKGFKRKIPLSDEILRADSKNITLINSATETNPLEMLISERKFIPVLKQVEGDQRWAARIRFYDGKTVIHLLSRGLKAIPHPFIKDIGGTPVLKDIDTVIRDKKLEYEINTSAAPISDMVLISPEIGNESRKIRVIKMNRRFSKLSIDLEGIKIYAVAQNAV